MQKKFKYKKTAITTYLILIFYLTLSFISCNSKEPIFPIENEQLLKIEKNMGCRKCSDDSIFRGRCFMKLGDHVIHYAKYYKDNKYDTEVYYNLKNYNPERINFYNVYSKRIFSMEINKDSIKTHGCPYYFSLAFHQEDSSKLDLMVYSMVIRGYAARTILQLSNNKINTNDTNIFFTDCKPFLYEIPFDTILNIDFLYTHYFSLEKMIQYHDKITYKLYKDKKGILKWECIDKDIKKNIFY